MLPEYVNEIIKLHEVDKWSTYQIAEKYGTYPNKINRLIRKYGGKIKNRSEAQKDALANGRAKHPTQGQEVKEDTRRKIAISMNKFWDELPDEERQKKVDQAKQNWNNMSDEQRHLMSRLASAAIRQAAKDGSKLEQFLQTKLNDLGYNVIYHKKHFVENTKLELDLFLPDKKIVIEVDGPSHFLPIWGEDKLQKTIASDAAKTGLLLSKGFCVIRIKNMVDDFTLIHQIKVIDNLLPLLRQIEDKFPDKGYRYFELEVA